MYFVLIVSTVTALLKDIEPAGSYPYTRKQRDCFETTNELHVDQTNNRMCLNLAHKNTDQCDVFHNGVYYDIFFDNEDAWRTQQRDYSNQTTSFCFPCVNDDCSFSKSTEMVSAKLVNEIYESDIPVGAIVQHRTNTSNCFQTSINKMIRGSNEVQFKLYPQECSAILTGCQLTKVVEEAYSTALLSSYVWDISVDQWNTIKIPLSDNFSDYYLIDLPFPNNNLDNGQIKSLAKLTMQCPNHEVILDTLIILIQSLSHLEIGSDRRAIVENTYVQLAVNGLYPPFDQIATDVVVKIDFNDISENKLLNRLTFNMPRVNFSLSYFDCAQFVDFMNPTNQTCETFLRDKVLNYMTKLKLNFNFYYNLNGQSIYATQTVAALTTGCWQYIDMTFSTTEVILDMTSDDTLCPFGRETKVDLKLLDTSYTSIYEGVIYYCNRSELCNQQIRIPCDSNCQLNYKEKDILFTITDDVGTYGEVWISQEIIVENPFRMNYFMIAAGGTGVSIFGMIVLLTLQQVCSKKKENKKEILMKLQLDPIDE
uniref:Uncharacterized protein n=1 Tax=Trepomonas sp. PC1 TaxID=1076344 RepID=A0A146KFM2_9EUKA|eukprot:JAP94978.1 hypothetical protein TPC1_12171 [Trepomonas sp. PC1]